MPETNSGTDYASPAPVEAVLSARSAAALVELQRADGKAAVLSTLASGTLVAAVAANPAWSTGPAPLTAAVLCGCALLLASVAAALIAIRPVLPQDRSLAELEPFRFGSVTANTFTDLATLDRAALGDRKSVV